MVHLLKKSKRKHQQIVKKLYFPKLSEPACLQKATTQREMDPGKEAKNLALELRSDSVSLSEGRFQQSLEQRAGRMPVFQTTSTETLTTELAGAPPVGELKSCYLTAIPPVITALPDTDVTKLLKEVWIKDNPDHQPPDTSGGSVTGALTRSQTARKATKLKEGIEGPLIPQEQQDPTMSGSTDVDILFKSLEHKIFSSMMHLGDSMNNLISKINALVDVNTQQMADYGAFKVETIERLEMCDQGLSDVQDQLQDVNKTIEMLQIQNKNLAKKVDYLENQSRRNNVKIVGLPEGIEGSDPRKFFTEWIPQVLGQDKFPEGLILERAHRALRSRPFSGQNPRPVLVRCLNYCDRKTILHMAIRNAQQNRSPLMVQSNRVFFYPDLSQEIMFQRREFNSVKELLWKKGYKATFRYTAVLKIFQDGYQPKFFGNRKEAMDFAQSLPIT
ncbi:uncharacterized protein [Narcine bancroftii]|uniref:uncharacterized protein n=1 Tax=Narcine bancroftii TaxID=1343680 RepID=UPI0038313E37